MKGHGLVSWAGVHVCPVNGWAGAGCAFHDTPGYRVHRCASRADVSWPVLQSSGGQMESLEVVTGGRTRSVTLTGKRVTIGRGDGNDVVIEGDARASREHAVLTHDGTTWRISDCNSTNGTYVNSVRISQPVRLSDGDRIHVGASVLTVQVQDEVVVRPKTIDLGTSPKVGDFTLSVEDRRLLALLAKGATDREIASVLNITTHEATEAVTDLAYRTSAPRRIDLARLGASLSMS